MHVLVTDLKDLDQLDEHGNHMVYVLKIELYYQNSSALLLWLQYFPLIKRKGKTVYCGNWWWLWRIMSQNW